MHLARNAVAQLGPRYAGIVPAIYSWKAPAAITPVDETGFGWMIMEYVSGIPFSPHFKDLIVAEKKDVLLEIATIFSAIQRMKLPAGVDRFGGLTFDDQGSIISGQETLQLIPGGPWQEYHQYWRNQLICQLNCADRSDLIDGWRAHGVRERLEQLNDEKFHDILKDGGVDMSKLALVHTDFSQ